VEDEQSPSTSLEFVDLAFTAIEGLAHGPVFFTTKNIPGSIMLASDDILLLDCQGVMCLKSG